MGKAIRAMQVMFVVALAATAYQAIAADLVRVQPREIDDLLANPGMGWQTSHRFADEDRALAGLPSSTAYFRLYWKQIEPKDGELNWAVVDDLLRHGRKAGQQIVLRVMIASSGRDYDYSPPWLREIGLPGFEFTYLGGPKHWIPDLDDPRVLARHLRLIEALGERYDGHRDLALVDIGSVGLWGEWHMSDTGVDMPTTETRRRVLDAYLAAFRKTPVVMQIGDLEGLKYATSRGAGWRADCLGDMGGFSRNWSHMSNLYPQQIERAGIAEVWKRAPVALETCWTMRKWVEEGWDIQYIFDWALAHHASYVNNKSSPIPEGTRPLVENLLRVLGYRFVLRSVEHSAEVARGQVLEVRMVWENVGVAPCYFDYRLAIALADSQGVRRVVDVGGHTTRKWFPKEFELTEALSVPGDLPPGEYEIQIAVVDPSTKEPVVQLAIAGRRADGWYPISRLTVRR